MSPLFIQYSTVWGVTQQKSWLESTTWRFRTQDWLLVILHSVQISPAGVAAACVVGSGYITMADANS